MVNLINLYTLSELIVIYKTEIKKKTEIINVRLQEFEVSKEIIETKVL